MKLRYCNKTLFFYKKYSYEITSKQPYRLQIFKTTSNILQSEE